MVVMSKYGMRFLNTVIKIRFDRSDHSSIPLAYGAFHLLQMTDKAQHVFSAAAVSTLHKALPAIEKLFLNWKRAAMKPHYNLFIPAISVAMDKLDKYYRLSAESDMHIMA